MELTLEGMETGIECKITDTIETLIMRNIQVLEAPLRYDMDRPIMSAKLVIKDQSGQIQFRDLFDRYLLKSGEEVITAVYLRGVGYNKGEFIIELYGEDYARFMLKCFPLNDLTKKLL